MILLDYSADVDMEESASSTMPIVHDAVGDDPVSEPDDEPMDVNMASEGLPAETAEDPIADDPVGDDPYLEDPVADGPVADGPVAESSFEVYDPWEMLDPYTTLDNDCPYEKGEPVKSL